MDLVSIGGLVVGLVGIIGGMIAEGGHLSSIIQPTAALIVLAGTAGAVLVGTTKEDLKMGLSLFRLGFGNDKGDRTEEIIAELTEAAHIARRESILALEGQMSKFSHPFMSSVLRYIIEGVDPNVVRETFESQIAIEEENQIAGAKIYVDAGGYSPTIGIIGAVLGLIHVMSNLTDTSKLGAGIAVAFVATIYGVGAANLLFLPLGSKIKRKIRRRMEIKELILEGAIGIGTGLSPFVIEEKLRSFLHDNKTAKAA